MTSAQSMPCPVCHVPLVMSERQGVEIDYCPQCRGVWLDRGELDKIIERASAELAPAAPPQTRAEPYPPQPQAQQPYRDERYREQGYRDGGYRSHKGYPKRKKSFLEELFD
ncbi:MULTISPECIES: zf-TFIIB domain-containing protein [unclassified Sphingobium]|uniref:TFIIB-type zinc ribbon-containing protein n=1 Tax=unclassified Sphingobium TaxID=2611147 RepID=UPI002224D8D1|nr:MULTISPECIES: zf-TFIIB domain-containing protein [unclassified Sphingobium]MCW2392468.1 Zn-finger nucleic acid-binding protein [Sphingobium sp. B11D3A]MCW2396116.1 Zn-finger nucleic acid-binding protein [Sphingobium sp. B8D3B]MCW2419632.1 Zn-finger nucleic acid-binding protein [Sphingobium sp. B8D3C]